VLADFVTSAQVEFLDVADATLTDTNGVITSASTDVNGVTTFVTEHPTSGAMDRVDNGGALYTFPLTDRLGQEFKRSLHMGTFFAGIVLDTDPDLASDVVVSIGLRFGSTTVWYTGGVYFDAGTKYQYTAEHAASAVSVSIPTLERMISGTNVTGPALASGMAWSFTTGSNYDRQSTRGMGDETNLTTAASLIVLVGYRATPGVGGAHATKVKLWYARPWAWTNRGVAV
jgi:hypothetical protein